MITPQNLKHILFFVIFTIISFIACNREELISTKRKSLKDNIFVKNAKGQLFSFDINSKKNGNKLISYVEKNEVITLGKSSFVDKTKPFFYNFNDVENLVQYIKEGKVWFISNNIDKKPTKISIPESIEIRKTGKTVRTDCECERAGTGDGNNDCEFDPIGDIPMCWTRACIQCDFIVCPDPVVSACLHQTHGGGVFVIADSVVLGNSTTKYILGQNTILKFEFYENETLCYREQFENTIYRNGIYNLNVPDLNSITNIDSFWFVPFEENTQCRNGNTANPTCRNDSCDGSCDLTTDPIDRCERCTCSKDGGTSSCKMILSAGLENGGVLLYTNDVTVIDL